MDLPLPQRRRPVHQPPVERHGQSTIVLLTVCTDRRRPLLAKPAAVAAILQSWRCADTWIVGHYMIMPDHLHAFCAPSSIAAPALVHWVKFWKTQASRHWPRPDEHPIWQQGFWDRQLRDAAHYSARWDYVRNNPVRHGLVDSAELWPWQGEMSVFRFHETS